MAERRTRVDVALGLLFVLALMAGPLFFVAMLLGWVEPAKLPPEPAPVAVPLQAPQPVPGALPRNKTETLPAHAPVVQPPKPAKPAPRPPPDDGGGTILCNDGTRSPT